MTVQVSNVAFFIGLGWVGFFFPITAVKVVEESRFLFAGCLCLCSMEKVKLCGIAASAQNSRKRGGSLQLNCVPVSLCGRRKFI